MLGIHEIVSNSNIPGRSLAEMIEFLLCDSAHQKPYIDVIQPLEMIVVSCRYICVNAASSPRRRWWSLENALLVLNVDASFVDDHLGSCGAIVRDHTGAFIGASTAKLEHVADIVSAEAAALVEGLKLAQSLGWNFILVQMDNLVLVEDLNLSMGHSVVATPILEECRKLSEEFEKVLFEHCNRESNMVAHMLAQQGRVDPLSLWSDSPPSFISRFLGGDLSIFFKLIKLP